MGKCLTFEEVKYYIESLGYILIDIIYINIFSKITFKDIDGFYYYLHISNLKKGFIPSKFHKSNPYTIQNIKLWCKLNNKPFELLSEEFKGANKNLKWRCLKEDCGEIFEANWNKIIIDRGCPFCAGHQVGLSNCLATKNPELASEWHPTKNDDLTPYDVTCGSKKYVWWKCKECGFEWDASIVNRRNNGCPKCAESKGEKRISKWLNLNNISYCREFVFNNLLSDLGNPLRYDFAIFDNVDKTQLNMLIEYDGKQHYEWVKGFYTKQDFIKIQYHDKLKNDYCINHNIKLLRIPYWDFDNIEEILDKEF